MKPGETDGPSPASTAKTPAIVPCRSRRREPTRPERLAAPSRSAEAADVAAVKPERRRPVRAPTLARSAQSPTHSSTFPTMSNTPQLDLQFAREPVFTGAPAKRWRSPSSRCPCPGRAFPPPPPATPSWSAAASPRAGTLAFGLEPGDAGARMHAGDGYRVDPRRRRARSRNRRQWPPPGKFSRGSQVACTTTRARTASPPARHIGERRLPVCTFFTSDVFGRVDLPHARLVEVDAEVPTFTESGGHLSVPAPAGTAAARQTAM